MTAVVPDPVAVGARTPVRTATPRRYLMCRPDALRRRLRDQPVDGPGRAGRHRPRRRAVGRAARAPTSTSATRVDVIDPVPGLPDMVFAANGATVVDGIALGAQFRHPQRAAEAAGLPRLVRRAGASTSHEAEARQRGRGRPPARPATYPARRHRLPHRPAPRTPRRRSSSAARSITLQLVDPRFYHLDTALAVLDDDHDRLPAGGVRARASAGPAAAVPGRGPRRPGRRRRARAQRGLRRPPRRPARAGRPAWPPQLARARLRARPGRPVRAAARPAADPKCCTLEMRS